MPKRFALILLRWVVVIMVTYFVLDIFPSSGPALLVLVVAYIGSIAAELAADRFLHAMHGDADKTKPDGLPADGAARPVRRRSGDR